MKSSILKNAVITCSLSFTLSVLAEPWDGANNPNNMSRIAGAKMELSFESLPLAGSIQTEGFIWSGSTWRSNLGGTSYRFAHPYPDPFRYALLSKEEVSKLGMDEMKELSPTELYDISQGDYNYSLTTKVRSMYSPRDLWWEGINHGWSQAAVNFAKPMDVTVINQDGIVVPFTSVHVQGLISLHEAYNYKGSAFGFMGKRCRVRGRVLGEEDPRDGGVIRPSEEEANSPDCSDVNAGAFHAVLANMIGNLGKSFVVDLDRYNDVSNHPVKSFKSQIMKRTPVEGDLIAEEVTISTTLVVADEVEAGVTEQAYRHRTYAYVVELDVNKNIVGGRWLSESRPDFIWLYAKKEKFVDAKMKLSGLNQIYKPTVK